MPGSLTKPDLRGAALARRYRDVRSTTESLAQPLADEDCVVQSMPDVSPTKWHLAHVSWFFETFVLKSQVPGYRPVHPDFEYLFNSYYNAVGEPYPRTRRGLLSRPVMNEVRAFRAQVDEAMTGLLERGVPDPVAQVVELGIQHEQQHQELLLMDIKHVFSCNPLFPSYRDPAREPGPGRPVALRWVPHGEGLAEIGHAGDGFCFDNELPRHRVFIEAFELASRLSTNGEYLEFINAGGYSRPDGWLADGWAQVRSEGWRAPLYWLQRDGEWFEFTLGGLLPLDPASPVCHVSFYEADAFAAWSGCRLPTEAEWEVAASGSSVEGNFVESGQLHPGPAADRATVADQLFGDVWEWTRSAYDPYPGFTPVAGALGEYNGKFMCNQLVLRGGSAVTPQSHARATYRNFFYPHCRWQFAGIRLAR